VGQLPAEYQVLTNLRDAIAGIRVGDGYYYDVRGTGVKLDPNQDVEALVEAGGPRPFVLIELNADSWQHMPAARARIDLAVTLHWVTDSDPTRDADRIQTYLQGCSDIEKLLIVDLQRGGLVIDTRIVRRTFDTQVDGSLVWASIEIVMPMIRTYGEPSVTV
jgi:hypothetical protein